MKYLTILLAVVACNNAPLPAVVSTKEGPNAVVSTETGSATSIALDSLIPAQYTAAGKIIKVEKTVDAWKRELSEKEFYVLRQEGTERAFTGDLWDHHADSGATVSAPTFSGHLASMKLNQLLHQRIHALRPP